MKLSETRQINAPRDTVWDALMDPEVLKECIPGCQELTGNPSDGFEATVTQKVGPVKATFKGTVSVSDIEEGQSCRLSGEGKGGAAGYAKGGADVRLASSGDGTELSYDAEANVGGKLAQLGSRIVDGFTKRLADQFFTKFQEVVEGRSGSAATEPGESAAKPNTPIAEQKSVETMEAAPPPKPAPKAEPTTPPEPEKKSWFKRLFG